jgi:hypothetical protein
MSLDAYFKSLPRVGETPRIARMKPTKPDTNHVPAKIARDLIAVHESAHAVVAHALGLEPIALTFDADGKGGACRLTTTDGAEPTTIAAWSLAGLVGERIAYGAIYTRHAGNAVDHNKAVEALAKVCADERAIKAAMVETEKKVERLLRKKWRLVEKLAAAMNASERGLLADDIARIIEEERKERLLVWRAKKRKQRAAYRTAAPQTLPSQQFVFETNYRGVKLRATSQRGIDVMKRMHDEMAKNGGVVYRNDGAIL